MSCSCVEQDLVAQESYCRSRSDPTTRLIRNRGSFVTRECSKEEEKKWCGALRFLPVLFVPGDNIVSAVFPQKYPLLVFVF